MMKFNSKTVGKNICYFILLLYLIAMSAYQLGTGFDAFFVRAAFVALIAITILFNKKIIITKQIKWCLLFWGYYFFSVLWAQNSTDTVYYINRFIQILGIFICLPLIIKNKSNIDDVLKLMVFSLIYTTLLLISRTPTSAWGTERIGAVLGLHPNTLGLRLSTGVIICIYFIHSILDNKLYKNRKISLIFYIFSMLLFIVVALFSGSKKALFSIVFGMFIFEVISSKGIKVLINMFLFGIIGIVIIFTVFNNEKLYSVIGRRLEKTILTVLGNASSKDLDTSLSERNYYIDEAMHLFAENPIVGVGGNNFVSYMRKIGYSHVAYSHNNYTELLATLGIVGFATYYVFWIKLLINLALLYKKNNSSKHLLFAILLMVLLILDYGNVSYVNEFNSIVLGLAFLSTLELEEGKKNEENT